MGFKHYFEFTRVGHWVAQTWPFFDKLPQIAGFNLQSLPKEKMLRRVIKDFFGRLEPK